MCRPARREHTGMITCTACRCRCIESANASCCQPPQARFRRLEPPKASPHGGRNSRIANKPVCLWCIWQCTSSCNSAIALGRWPCQPKANCPASAASTYKMMALPLLCNSPPRLLHPIAQHHAALILLDDDPPVPSYCPPAPLHQITRLPASLILLDGGLVDLSYCPPTPLQKVTTRLSASLILLDVEHEHAVLAADLLQLGHVDLACRQHAGKQGRGQARVGKCALRWNVAMECIWQLAMA